MTLTTTLSKLEIIAKSVGLEIMGISDLTQRTNAAALLAAWQDSGFAGEMSFMNRDPQLLTSPLKLLPSSKSLVMFAISYAKTPRQPLTPGFGRVARYAWGRDYHRVLKKRLRLLVQKLETSLGGIIEWKAFSDAVPLLEREFAIGAGLGFRGKNTMVIRPKMGSMFFIAEILWNVEILAAPATSKGLPILGSGGCGACARCIKSCPTQAFPMEYVLDARKCISYLTIEKEGLLCENEMTSVGEWIFGCDICQEVCPFNHSPMKKLASPAFKEFNPSEGVGPELDLRSVLSIRGDAEYLKRFAGTPLMRPGREGLIRNALIVSANTGQAELVDLIKEVYRAEVSPVLKGTADWAIQRLS